MEGYAVVPDPAVSIAKGIPLADEPGLGALTMPALLDEVTARYGTAEAIAQPRPDGTVERWSYEELRAKAMDIARALTACGVGKGTRVGMLVTNRAELVASAFGAAMAGGVTTVFSTFSTAYELDMMLAAAGCSVLLIEPQVLKKDFSAIVRELEPAIATSEPGTILSAKYPFLRHVVSLDTDETAGGIECWNDFLARGEAVSEAQVEARAASVAPSDPGVLLFSSGTTGKPKGILSAHRGACIQMWRWPRILGMREGDRVLTANGFFWSGHFSMAMGGTLASGGTLVLQSVFEPVATLRLYESEKVTVPMAWLHQWEQLGGAANIGEVDLSSLRHVPEGTPLRDNPTVSTTWQEPTRIYGNTETFTISTAYVSGTPEEVLQGAWGFPVPGATLKIVDPFTGATMPMGERGELAVKGPTLMLGYIGVPLDETLDAEGFYRTGDGGYLDAEGRLFWEGRLNDIIKTGGANVSPVEVDTLLLTYPGVKIVQTIGVPDDLLGELVVSCIVPHAGQALDAETIRAFAKEKLASYKVPRRVLFFEEADFQQTGSSKVKVETLKELAAGRLAEG